MIVGESFLRLFVLKSAVSLMSKSRFGEAVRLENIITTYYCASRSAGRSKKVVWPFYTKTRIERCRRSCNFKSQSVAEIQS